MPTLTFETVVANVTTGAPREVAIAQASAYLAYADQTDTFGLDSKIVKVEEMEHDVIRFMWKAPVVSKEQRKTIAAEIEQLVKVESHECISNPMNAKA